MPFSWHVHVVQIGNCRIGFIGWSDHIHPKIALEYRHVESYLKDRKIALSGIVGWFAAARMQRRMDDDR
jgi:hypothetical protein